MYQLGKIEFSNSRPSVVVVVCPHCHEKIQPSVVTTKVPTWENESIRSLLTRWKAVAGVTVEERRTE